jgi:hypothetical protein
MVETHRPAEMFRLDRSTCLALLSIQHVGRIIIDAGAPLLRVVNYSAIDETIVFRSDRGPRIDDIVDRPVVFEVDMFDERTRSGWSVVVRGTARDVTDSYTGPDGDDARVDPWAPGPKNCWISIDVEDLSGRLLRGEVRPTWVHPQAYL